MNANIITTLMLPITMFRIGQTVQWVSQSNGHAKMKTGRVCQIVPPGELPVEPVKSVSRIGEGGPRRQASYLILVREGVKLLAYWPDEHKLNLVQAKAA